MQRQDRKVLDHSDGQPNHLIEVKPLHIRQFEQHLINPLQIAITKPDILPALCPYNACCKRLTFTLPLMRIQQAPSHKPPFAAIHYPHIAGNEGGLEEGVQCPLIVTDESIVGRQMAENVGKGNAGGLVEEDGHGGD